MESWDPSGVWSDLVLIVNFLFNTLSSISNVVMNTILILAVGLFVLRLVVKFFKKIV